MNYKNINDYEVLYLVSEDMDSSYDVLFQKYTPIIKSISRRYFSFASTHGAEYQDLIQEGYLGLNNAIVTYRDNGNSIFYTYACLCIERHLYTYCRSLAAKKHQILNTAITDDLYSCTLIEDTSEFCTFFRFYPLELQSLLLKCIYSMDLDTRCVFELRFNGFSYYEISQLLDLSLSTVDSKISKARKILKKSLQVYFKN